MFNPFDFYMPFLGGLIILMPIVFALKGFALWHAAKRGELWWFIALLVINTMGILELVYIIGFLKKNPLEMVGIGKKEEGAQDKKPEGAEAKQ